MPKPCTLEQAIRDSGGVQFGEITTHAGQSANQKLELDNNFLEANPLLADQIVDELAPKIARVRPRLVVPVPEGANTLGRLISSRIGSSYMALRKHKGRDNTYGFICPADRIVAEKARSIALIDDVYTTGSSIKEILAIPEFNGSITIAGVIWDRSEYSLPKEFDFDVVSAVRRFLPLRVQEPA